MPDFMRIKDFDKIATQANGDDFIAIDGAGSGTRRMKLSLINKDRLDTLDEQVFEIQEKLKNKKYKPRYFGGNIWVESNADSAYYDNLVERAMRIGMNSFLIPVYHEFKDDVLKQTKSDTQVQYAIDSCKRFGAEYCALKLHISPNSGVNPSNYEDFMNTWKNIVRHFAELSKQNGLNTMYIMNEQTYLTSSNQSKWVEIIDMCHDIGIKCFCSFAGFEEYERCCFVEYLDGIGINYYPHAGSENPTEKSTIEAFGKNVSKNYLFKFKEMKEQLRSDIPLYISEIGCCNNVESLYKPAAYKFSQDIKREDYQAWYYNAFLQEIGAINTNLDGIFVWSLSFNTNRTSANFSPLFNTMCEGYIENIMKED